VEGSAEVGGAGRGGRSALGATSALETGLRSGDGVVVALGCSVETELSRASAVAGAGVAGT
jgi:hypothetical protein